jgi:acetyltransferase-like isoleucine patch superfamily enzyme
MMSQPATVATPGGGTGFANRAFFVVQGLLKYLPFQWTVRVRALVYRPFFRTFGSGVHITDNVVIKYPNEIDLGDRVRINEGCYIVGRGGLSIGADTMIGAGTKIVTTTHVYSRTDIPMARQGMTFSSITIAEDVWFGFDAKILGGTTIGQGAIVGAGTFISGHDIPAYAIVAGNPGRVRGSRLDANLHAVASTAPTD